MLAARRGSIINVASVINGAALAVDSGWTADGGWESLRLRHRQAAAVAWAAAPEDSGPIAGRGG